jgi:trimeric autotransporter adhesin
MSTKTTFKRVALVAVASLGFGMLSVAPSSAASSAAVVGTASQATTVGTSTTTTVGSTIANTDTDPGTLSITVPTGSSVTLADRDGRFSTATTAVLTSTATGFTFNSTTGAVAITATPTSFAGTVTIIPDVPGLYTVTFTAAGAGGGNASATARMQAAGIAGTVGTDGLGTRSMGATTGGIARFTFTTPAAQASGDVYRFTSTGVGSITAATGVAANGTSANDPVPTSGAAGVWSSGATWTRSDASAGTATITVASTVAGTQTVTVTSISASTGAPTSSTSILITWGGAVSLAAASTAFMAGPADTTATATTNAVARVAPRAVGTPIATVVVSLVNSLGAADARANSLRATVSGVGFVDVDGTAGSLNASTVLRTDVNTEADASRFVRVYSDGTAGTGTLTVTATDADSGASITLGTFTYTSTGAQASIAVSTTRYTIGRAGFTTGGATADNSTLVASATATPSALPNTADAISTPAFVVVVRDSAGSPVTASAVPTVTSSNPLVSLGGTCALDNGLSATHSSSTNGIGFYNCNFSTVSTAVSGATATLTISIPNPASTTGGTLDATYAISVGGAPATQTLAFDKATYEQGEGMTITRTAVDAAGNKVYDGAVAPAVTFNRAIGGTAPGAAFYINGTTQSNNTLGAATVFAPTSAGAFTATITGRVAAALATINATATVGDDAATTAAAAAGDAAAEATDAANAATDAANAAAEAADAATAAAQDAADAVAALSTSVTAMVDSLRKQITSLTNLVIKIQRKVRA